MNSKHVLSRLAALFVLTALVACGGGGGNAAAPGPAPAKFSLTIAPASLTVGQGQGALVEVTIVRDAGFTEPVRVTLSQPPAGIADDTLVFSGSLNRGLLPIRVGADVAVGSTHRLDVMGTAAEASQVATSNLTVSAPQPYAQNLIAAALDAGTLDYATSLLYRAYALFGDNRLPNLYLGAGSLEEDNGLFHEIRQRLASLPVAAQNQLQPFIVRPADPRSVRNNAAPAALAQANKTGDVRPAFSAPSPATCAATAAGSWISKRSASHPVRVWAQCRGEPAKDADSVTLIDKTLVVLNKVYAPMTRVMGQPLFDLEGDDNAIDFYIVDEGSYVRRRGENFKPVGLGTAHNDYAQSPVSGARGNSAFVTLPRSLLYTSRFHTTVIHEFFHVLQIAHNDEFAVKPIAGQPDKYERHWFAEASATWAAAHFDRTLAPWDGGRGAYLGAHYLFKDIFLPSVEALNTSGNDFVAVDYSAYIWPYFVEQETGGTDFMTNIWARLAAVTTFEAADNAISQAYPFATNFKRFALRNINREFLPGNPLPPLPRDKRHVHLDPDQFADDGEEPPYLTGTLVANREYSQELQLKNLSARYVRLTVPEASPEVRKVVFDTTGLQPASELDVQAVVLTDNGWLMQPVDITPPGRVVFCFDNGPTTASVHGSFKEIWLVISNHAIPKGTDVSGTLRVLPSSRPCGTVWTGTLNFIHRALEADITQTSSATVIYEFDDTALQVPGEIPFRLRSGTYNYDMRANGPACRSFATAAGAIPLAPYQPNVPGTTSAGFSILLDSSGGPSRYGGYGFSVVTATETSNCRSIPPVDETTINPFFVHFWGPPSPYSGDVSADGNSINTQLTTPEITVNIRLNRVLE